MIKASIAVAMLGARQHYAIPEILHRNNLLHTLYTDGYSGKRPIAARVLHAIPSGQVPLVAKKWLSRQSFALPPDLVRSHDLLGMEYAWRLSRAQSHEERYEVYELVARKFGGFVNRHDLGRLQAVYCYNSAAREIFDSAKALSIRCILDQTEQPHEVEVSVIQREIEKRPDWARKEERVLVNAARAERERDEWALADVILVPAQFIAEDLERQGVAADKIKVIPYGISPTGFPRKQWLREFKLPLRVAFVGEVGFRKGAQYLLEAIAELGPNKVEARFAGNLTFRRRALEAYAINATFLGPVPRSEIRDIYEWADVLVLPSLSDSFGVVVYEALASGLPAVVSTKTGAMVRDGFDGFVVPAADSAAIAKALSKYIDDPDVLAAHTLNTRESTMRTDLERYEADILDLLGRVLSAGSL